MKPPIKGAVLIKALGDLQTFDQSKNSDADTGDHSVCKQVSMARRFVLSA